MLMSEPALYLYLTRVFGCKKCGETELLIPRNFLLQSSNVGHIEHDPKEEQRFTGKLVQLLFQRLLQFHPSHLLTFALKPKTEVVCLEKKTVFKRKLKLWASLQRATTLNCNEKPLDIRGIYSLDPLNDMWEHLKIQI